MSRRLIPVSEDECVRLVEFSGHTNPIPLAFGTGGVAVEVEHEDDKWIMVVLADWRGVELSPATREAHPLPPHVAAVHVVPDSMSNRAGAS